MTFSQTQKSSVLTVVNEDKNPVSLRVKAMEWTQDKEGNDVYEDTKELIFFPKRLELKPGDKRVIRVGVRKIEFDKEKAFRLFVEELPPPQKSGDGSTKLAVLITFGLPVFVSPRDAAAGLSVIETSVSGNELSLLLKNTGNKHGRLSRLLAENGDIITESIPGRYLHSGTIKKLNFQIPKAMCDGGSHRLVLEAESQQLVTEVLMPVNCKG
jgi:fimbrial chaperone protein